MNKRIEGTNERIDSLRLSVDKKIDDVNKRIEGMDDGHEAKFEDRRNGRKAKQEDRFKLQVDARAQFFYIKPFFQKESFIKEII